MGKIDTTERMLDEKDGQISILEYNIRENMSTVQMLEDRLVKAQQAALECQKRAIISEKETDTMSKNVDEMRKQLEENLVQMEFFENEINQSKEALCSIEVYTGTEMKTLYSNVSLLDNIVKLGDY